MVNPEEAENLHLQQQEITENAPTQKFQPATYKASKPEQKKPAPQINDDPVYVQVKTQSVNNSVVEERENPEKIMQTEANSEGEPEPADEVKVNEINVENGTEELPTIKTEIQPDRTVPQFEDVQVKSKLDEKAANRIVNKADNRVTGLVDLAESKEEF